MTTQVDQALTELADRLATLAPQHEGLRDFARLNLQSNTRAVVMQALSLYDRRVGLIVAAQAALKYLVADSYPELVMPDIDAASMADLQDNTTTIEAAFGLFTRIPAASLSLTAGAAVKKDGTNGT